MGTMGLSPLSSLHAEPLFLGGDGRIRGPLLEILKEWPVDFKDPPQLGHRHGRLVNPQVDDKVRRAETAIELVAIAVPNIRVHGQRATMEKV